MASSSATTAIPGIGSFTEGERRQHALCEVTPDVIGQQLIMVNVYFAGLPGAGDREWALVDAGLPGTAGRILRAAEAIYGPGSRPAAIILTHGHFDHVGAIEELQKRWDVPIYAHELEMPYLAGRSSYPPPDPAVGGGLMSLLSRFYPRGPIDLGSRVRTLPGDGSVPGMPGWRWLHTPGHTPGHVSLFRDADRALLAGDAFVTRKQESLLGVLAQWPGVRRPPAYYTSDWDAARESVEHLSSLRPRIAGTGHGLPMGGERLDDELRQLAWGFDRIGRPARGRYTRTPAVANALGVVSVPPPVLDHQLIAIAGIAALGVGLTWLARHR